MINKITIIGVGLIGGSLARSLRKVIDKIEIVGCGRSEGNLKKAVELGVIDRYSQDLKNAIKDADIIFISTPMGAMKDIFTKINGAIEEKSIITDAGSTKNEVIKDFIEQCPTHIRQFVPGHPVAGTEHSGVESSVADLFERSKVIITPLEDTSKEAITLVKKMWEICGASVIRMNSLHHDQVLAATSHLPHLLAFGLVDALSKREESDEIFQYAAGGFKDFTRIASSNPKMWRDICLSNSEEIIKSLDEFSVKIKDISDFLTNKDAEKLLKIFSEAKIARDKFLDRLD